MDGYRVKEPLNIGTQFLLDDPQKREELLAGIALGLTYASACKSAGVGLRTFQLYRRRCPEFDRDVQRAELKLMIAHLDNLNRAAVGELGEYGGKRNWRASLQWLARRYPREWGKVRRHEMAVSDSPIRPAPQIDLERLTPGEREQLQDLHAKMDGGNDRL